MTKPEGARLIYRSFFRTFLILCLLPTLIQCASTPRNPMPTPHFDKLIRHVQKKPPRSATVAENGPFSVETRMDFEIPLGTRGHIQADLSFPTGLHSKAPLVVFIHGSHSDKEAHWQQALHLSRWGMICMVIDLPVFKVWRSNGQKIARIIKRIQAWPATVHEHVDANSILLVGHSFGGSAAVVAAAQVPVRGTIFLDAAIVHPDIVATLPKMKGAAIYLGADPAVYKAKGRSHFYEKFPGPILETTLIGADHDDAQWPTMIKIWFGFDPFTDSEKQLRFRSLTTIAALALGSHLGIDFMNAYLKNLPPGQVRQTRLKKGLEQPAP